MKVDIRIRTPIHAVSGGHRPESCSSHTPFPGSSLDGKSVKGGERVSTPRAPISSYLRVQVRAAQVLHGQLQALPVHQLVVGTQRLDVHRLDLRGVGGEYACVFVRGSVYLWTRIQFINSTGEA